MSDCGDGDVVDQALDQLKTQLRRMSNASCSPEPQAFSESPDRHWVYALAQECIELVDTLEKLYPKIEEPMASIGTITVDIAKTESVVKIMNAIKTMLKEQQAIFDSTDSDVMARVKLETTVATFKTEVFHEWAAMMGGGGE